VWTKEKQYNNGEERLLSTLAIPLGIAFPGSCGDGLVAMAGNYYHKLRKQGNT
jgi:hypothetical protein